MSHKSIDQQLKIAKEIALEAHESQFRFDGVTPYITHVDGVVNAFGDDFKGEKIVAWLHDVIEDSNWTADELRISGIDDCYIDAVVLLTKVQGEDYDTYLVRLKKNYFAKTVKIQDILYNLGDTPSSKQVKKYAKALKCLL